MRIRKRRSLAMSSMAAALALGAAGVSGPPALGQIPVRATPQHGPLPAGQAGQPGSFGALGPGSTGMYPGGAPDSATADGRFPSDGSAGMGAGAGAGTGADTGAGATDASNAGADASAALDAALASRANLATGSGGSLGFPTIGDQGPLTSLVRRKDGVPNPFPPPRPPGVEFGRGSAILAPSVRAFKISDDQSPRPQDRVFYALNYFNNVSGDVNRRFDSPVQSMKVYRNIFGLEKTFNDGYGSIGVRLPLYTLTADSRTGGFNTPTSTALGDLGLFLKYIVAEDKKTGSLITAGLLMTPPTGPSQFAGANYVNSLHSMQFQPFIGYLWNRDRFFAQGFTAIDVPTDDNDVTMLYNDVTFGYLVYRDDAPASERFVTAVAPTFEVHVNTPLNHRGAYNFRDIAATADNVNLTFGLNLELMRSAVASFGVVTPVTSPKPFDVEAVFLLNVRYGPNRTRRIFPTIAN